MGDPGKSAVLTRYEFMRLRSLRKNEITTARDPVQHKRCTYRGTGRSIRNINIMDALMMYEAFQTIGKSDK